MFHNTTHPLKKFCADIKNPDAPKNTYSVCRRSVVLSRYDYRGYGLSRLIRESYSALCTSSLEDFSAVRGSHSLSEAVLLLSLTLFRLIGSKHLDAPPCEMVIGSVIFC